MKKVLVAGATGYLGKYLLKELKNKGYHTIALARNAKRLKGITVDRIIESEVTRPETLEGVCDGVDDVISTVGITHQKDGLTYMDVDYQANMNLLFEALNSGVSKFMYVSVLNGQYMKDLKMVEAKEHFVDGLKASGMDYCIIRPNGFFSDLTEVLNMAKKGAVHLFGNGEYRTNPIHGADLAEYMVDHLEYDERELEVGGPDLMTQNEIADVAFKAAGKTLKISHLPIWIRDISLWLTRLFTGQRTYGPMEFFMTVMTRDMVAPKTGHQHLINYYYFKMDQERVNKLNLQVG
ncbi:MAG: SDR family oxidoreductase [Cyclobacteriaceae bacterium]